MYDWFETEGYHDYEMVDMEPVDVRWLCESQQIYLRPNHIYKFVVKEDCEKCRELAAHYE